MAQNELQLQEARMNAEAAFANRKYDIALEWYQKALALAPEDLFCLSRAGAVCVSLGRFEDALRYFSTAKELDPNNGDNAFNYANACFFRQDYAGAFENYVAAERLGCSDRVTPRLYYQMALLCSARQDIKAALAYFRKCEDADPDGSLSLSPDLISEKLKLYLAAQDTDQAEICAAQLCAIQPTSFRAYMTYFSVLMAGHKYDTAEKVLSDARAYAELSDRDRLTLDTQLASLYSAMADARPQERRQRLDQATDLLKTRLAETPMAPETRDAFLITLAELLQKDEQYDRAIACLRTVLENAPAQLSKPATAAQSHHGELTPEELEAMIDADLELVQQYIDIGALDADLGMYAEMAYDENGNLVPQYDEAAFDVLMPAKAEAAPQAAPQAPAGREIALEVREKVYFDLLSCFLGKDDFAGAEPFARVLRTSENRYYNYYGRYTQALITRKLLGSCEKTDRLYAETLAFFRSRLFADPSDSLAVIFRGRLYAESGQTEKARELANLLPQADADALTRYIDSCRV